MLFLEFDSVLKRSDQIVGYYEWGVGGEGGGDNWYGEGIRIEVYVNEVTDLSFLKIAFCSGESTPHRCLLLLFTNDQGTDSPIIIMLCQRVEPCSSRCAYVCRRPFWGGGYGSREDPRGQGSAGIQGEYSGRHPWGWGVECHQCLKVSSNRDADFPLFSVFSVNIWPDPFSVDPFPVFRFLYFLLFHLSLSELSVSFCVHFLWDGTHT